jgi:hypothetical protein
MNADSAIRSFVCRWANATADSATGGYPAEALGLLTRRFHRRWAQAGISWRYHGLCPWGSMGSLTADEEKGFWSRSSGNELRGAASYFIRLRRKPRTLPVGLHYRRSCSKMGWGRKIKGTSNNFQFVTPAKAGVQ